MHSGRMNQARPMLRTEHAAVAVPPIERNRRESALNTRDVRTGISQARRRSAPKSAGGDPDSLNRWTANFGSAQLVPCATTHRGNAGDAEPTFPLVPWPSTSRSSGARMIDAGHAGARTPGVPATSMRPSQQAGRSTRGRRAQGRCVGCLPRGRATDKLRMSIPGGANGDLLLRLSDLRLPVPAGFTLLRKLLLLGVGGLNYRA